MPYCIVDTVTRRKYRRSYKYAEDYATLSAAKAALTRYTKDPKVPAFINPMKIMTLEEYRAQVQMKKVKVLGTENWIEIPEDTPPYCDPSREQYWSM
jgi:hypothetical protein